MQNDEKKKLKKLKKIEDAKDERMVELKKEILKLEVQHRVLEKEKLKYRKKFEEAVLRGIARLNSQHQLMNNATPSSSIAEDSDEDENCLGVLEDDICNLEYTEVGPSPSRKRKRKFSRQRQSTCPERDPCEGAKEQKMMKDRKLTDAERLDKLEKEVTLLRNDFDRVKWEQAVAETAIGRAIIRGSASLGSTGFGMMGQASGECGGPMKNRQLMDDPQKNPCSKNAPQLPGKNSIADGKQKPGKEECGYFTLG